jgi:hypothetical protein
MLRKSWWASALVLAIVTAPSFGQDKLEWKFKQGEKFYVESVQNIKQSIEFMGQSMKQDMKNTTVSSFEVKEKTANKVVLEQKILSVKMKSTGGAGGGEAEKMGERMKGAVFTVTLGPDGRITKFEGYDDMIKKLTRDNKEAAKMTRMMLPKETFEKAVAEVFGFLPKKAVSKGDTWKKDLTLSMGPIGSFKQDTTYTHQGKGADGVKIGLTSKLTYTPPKGDGGGLPFKVTKGDLTSKDFKGTIVFDPTKGRMGSSKIDATIKGTITMEIMDREIEMTMEQNMSMTSKVLDKAPADD